MKKTKRLKLTFSQALTHYGTVIFLVLFVAVKSKSIIENYINDTYADIQETLDSLAIPFLFLLLAVVLFQIQYRKLKFRTFAVSFTDEQFQEAVQRTIKDLGWRIENNNKTFLRAYIHREWTIESGEMITIIKYKDRFLINCIFNPNTRHSIVSFGRNTKNVKTFLKNLEDTLNNIPEKQRLEEEVIENEWSIKNIFIRIFTYPLSIFFILLGIYAVLNPLRFKTIIAGIGAITISSIYLYTDLQKLLKKTK